ncbi:MAG: helix-hairpin-helix domain-containing protein [Bacteroidia bacterium]|nr:helix-hairpin-helix domain-containing protein [Bacteroidia bacterium]MDW8159472.1 helix-hairpin-helix domain-containing protein [Bacteroidia bacterium]
MNIRQTLYTLITNLKANLLYALPQSQFRGLLVALFFSSLIVIHAYFDYKSNNQVNLAPYIPQLDAVDKIQPLGPRSIEINTADSLTLLKLPGVGPTLARRIIAYRKKKKYFRSIQELAQVYGLEYEKVSPFLWLDSTLLAAWEKKYAIRPPSYKQNLNTITADNLQSTHLLDSSLAQRLIHYRDKRGGFDNWQQVAKVYGIEKWQIELLQQYYYLELPKLELNQADSLALVRLPGIGLILARRILRYKKSLGGYYYSVKQLREVYGISEQTYAKISHRLYVDTLAIKKLPKIQINLILAEELEKHPYFKKNQRLARRIINFRNKYGPFRSSQDLMKVYDMEVELIQKLSPYLSYEIPSSE